MDDITLYATLRAIRDAEDFRQARAIADATLTPDTVICARFYKLAFSARSNMYNPDDYGLKGKQGEVAYRICGWVANGRKWAKWGEFGARRHGMADADNNTEHKTSVGDWLYSRRFSDRDKIINEWYNKAGYIHWETQEFTIHCTWKQLFDYLSTYPLGLNTWFKTTVKYNSMTAESVVAMQEYKTSKRKTAFLIACPYNQA